MSEVTEPAKGVGTIRAVHELSSLAIRCRDRHRQPRAQEGKLGGFLFWIVLIGLPALLAGGFAYAHYLKRTGGTTRHEDGA